MFSKILNKKNIKLFLGIIIFSGIFFAFLYQNKKETTFVGKDFSFPNSSTSEKTIEEANSMENSKSDNWWLSSGGIMNVNDQEFSTNIGKLSEDSKWQKLYKKNNSRDTDKGYHPQNIFRLVTKGKWRNLSQSIYFYIENINLSYSSYRNDSNGILFFNRYQDKDNLYYTGLRVDGNIIIKKKIDGKYYNIAQKQVLQNLEEYDRSDYPNLIPEQKWIGIKTEIIDSWNDSVLIKVYLDLEGDGDWKLILKAKDNGEKYGESPFFDAGYAGIRTDFMDVKFRNYQIIEKE